MASQLVDKFLNLAADLSEAERDDFKLLLGAAAGALGPAGHLPEDGGKSLAFQTVLSCLANLQHHAARVPANGIAWRGRPDLLTDALLARLQAEVADRRVSALDLGNHLLGCGGPIADELAVSPALVDFAAAHAGRVTPTGIASYLYYEQPGHGLDAHVDTGVFSLNLIIKLRHENGDDDPANLVVYPPGKPPERIDLAVGEVVLLFAGSVVHGREPMKENEVVQLLTIGFEPVD